MPTQGLIQMLNLQHIIGKARHFWKGDDDFYSLPERIGYRWGMFKSRWGLLGWRNFRRELLRRLARACGVQLGQVSPWYLIVLRCIMFPSNGLQYLCEKIVPVGYEPWSDSFRVGKHRFDRWFLEDLAGFPDGAVFRMVKKEHNTITIEKIGGLYGHDSGSTERRRSAGQGIPGGIANSSGGTPTAG